jgi:hypothetical protein
MVKLKDVTDERCDDRMFVEKESHATELGFPPVHTRQADTEQSAADSVLGLEDRDRFVRLFVRSTVAETPGTIQSSAATTDYRNIEGSVEITRAKRGCRDHDVSYPRWLGYFVRGTLTYG